MPMQTQTQEQATLNVKLVHFTKQNSPDDAAKESTRGPPLRLWSYLRCTRMGLIVISASGLGLWRPTHRKPSWKVCLPQELGTGAVEGALILPELLSNDRSNTPLPPLRLCSPVLRFLSARWRT